MQTKPALLNTNMVKNIFYFFTVAPALNLIWKNFCQDFILF